VGIQKEIPAALARPKSLAFLLPEMWVIIASMQNNKNLLLGLLIVVVIIITAGIFVFSSKKNDSVPAVVTTTNSASSTQTTTATTTATTTTQQGNNDAYPGWKIYENKNLGINFRYPNDYVLKSDSYNGLGLYTATFGSPQGTIVLSADKKLNDPSSERLQSKTITMGGKTATLFTSRRDVCDVAVARTALDTEYSVQIAFESCGNKQTLFKDTKTIDSVVSSTSFQNQNTNLFVSTGYGIAFRTYVTAGKPAPKLTSNSALFTVGKGMSIQVGSVYSATARKNLTFTEAVTEAAKAKTVTNVPVTIDGKQGQKLTYIPTSGPKEVSIYLPGKTATEIIIMKESGVDTADLDLAVASFKFIK
jgi:uncharacterized protein (UPF0333 family)